MPETRSVVNTQAQYIFTLYSMAYNKIIPHLCFLKLLLVLKKQWLNGTTKIAEDIKNHTEQVI